MGNRGGGMSPDTRLEISLNGTAGKLAGDDTTAAAAAAELREIADGRTDLLGKAAGSKIGGILGTAQANPLDLLAAYYLVLAGADHDALATEADVVRERVNRSAYKL